MPIFEILIENRQLFFHCVEKCNACYRSGEDLDLYRQIIARHRENCSLNALFDQLDFIKLIYQTLVAWNMDQRGAKLSSFEELVKTIRQNRPLIQKLYNYKLHELTDKTVLEITPILELAFGGLKVMHSKRRIVGVSKCLHFLLPDLVMPIDSTYTMPALFGYNRYSDSLEKETNDFILIFRATTKAAQKLKLTPADLKDEGWNTSIPKLIDNALIGLAKLDSSEIMEKIKPF